MSSKKVDVLILGGGLTGLAAAARLAESSGAADEILVVEKEKSVGGLCRSFEKNGYTFDFSGHLLHLRRPEIKRWVSRLLDGNLREIKRDARIFSEGRLTKYPYQMNLWGLPRRTVEDCLSGLISAHIADRSPSASGSFLKWSLGTFGAGLTERFMRPYNEKLWRAPAGKFNAEWCGDFVPRPNIEDAVAGALSDAPKKIGYNATFFYPRRGGIQSLVDALGRSIDRRCEIRPAVRPEKIDLSSKKALLSDGSEIKYRRLVSTIPLPEFARVSGMTALARRLAAVSIVCLNVGARLTRFDDDALRRQIHWIYFPENKYPFYRVGFYSHISPPSAPRGRKAMYVEVSVPPGAKADLEKISAAAARGLVRAGIIDSLSDITELDVRPMPGAYVMYDFKRAATLAKIRAALTGTGATLAGRYGGWKYSYMEESLAEARALACDIAGEICPKQKSCT